MALGFQSGAFQYGAFQQATASTQIVGGGKVSHHHWRRDRTQEEIREERIRLGIIAAPVKKSIAKVVRQIVRKADKKFDDPLELLRAEQAKVEAQLARSLKAQEIEFQTRYMAYMALEIARVMQEREDEQIVQLLMEM
jgi:hypothetical protein